MNTVNNIPTGLLVPAQVPLDAKLYVANEASLLNLGVSNNLAYTYYEGMIVYCVAEQKRYEWREGAIGEIGLLPVGFTYPSPLVVNGVDYSNRTFNFYYVLQNMKIANVGIGAPWYKGVDTLTNTHQFRTFTSAGLLITTGVDEVNIENKSGLNLGTGVASYKGVNPSSKLHEFRTFKSVNPAISITQVGDEIQFNATFYNTVIQAGTGINVTGTGTAVDPYIISLAPTTSPWLTGDIKEVFCTPTYLTTYFTQSGPNAGLGIGERAGWAICNGNNGTPNDDGKVIVAYGTSYPVLGATGGSTDAVVVSHAHYVAVAGTETTTSDTSLYDGSNPTKKEKGLTTRAYNQGSDPFDYELTTSDGPIDSGKTSSSGESGAGKNMQPYVVRLKIMKL